MILALVKYVISKQGKLRYSDILIIYLFLTEQEVRMGES